MSKSANDEKTYPFFWLNEILEITLNPAKTNLKSLSNTELEQIRDKLPAEIEMVSSCLKTQAFSLYCNEQLRVVAGQYDQVLQLLLRQARMNLSAYPKTGAIRQLGVRILQALEELVANVHDRYRTFLPEKPQVTANDVQPVRGLLDKVLCALSADQVGIVLKSAYDVKLILGKSFRKVCKALAPYLSTPWKSDIS